MVRCTSLVSYRTNKLLNSTFQWLGETIYKRPWLFILIGLVITFIAGSGLMFIEVESAIINLWVPQSDPIYDHHKLQEEYFGAYAQGLVLLFKGHNGENIMTPKGLTQAHEAMQVVISDITGESDGVTYTFEDVCARVDVTSTQCVVEKNNLHEIFFKGDQSLWLNQEDIDDVLNVDGINYFLGNMQYDDNDQVIGANVIRVFYELTTTTDDAFKDALIEYQRAFIDYWSDHANDYDQFEVVYTTSYGITDEILRVSMQEAPLFIIAFAVMLVYLQFTLGGCTCVRARALLATTSIFILIFSLIFGFGVASYLGMKFSTLVFVVPFLLLGVGVDNMIIVVDTMNHTKLPDNNEENRAKQLGLALQHSGVSVSLTSFCSVVAFFSGAITDLPGVQYFSYYAAFSFLGNYILQFCLFVPLLVYDDKRIRQNRNFCCPCFVHNAGQSEDNEEDEDEEDEEDYNAPARCCSLNWILQNSLIKLLSSSFGRICIIATFVALIGISGYYGTKVEATSDPTLLVPDDSWFIDFSDLTDTAWAGDTPTQIQIILVGLDFSDATVRQNVYSLMSKVESLNAVSGEVDNWLEPFTKYVYDTKGTDIDSIADKETFYRYLKDFEGESDFVQWDNELIFNDDNNPTSIIVTKFYFSALEPKDSMEQYDSYLFYNDLLKEEIGSDSDSFMLQETWVYASFNHSIKENTFRNLIISTIAVLIILLFLMDIRLAIFIMIIIIGIDVCLFGWMYMIGIDLQTISFCQLCMAVGLTVDYVIHMVHAVAEIRLDKNNNTYSRRIKIAMYETGASVIKGATTTFIGSAVLLFAASVAFRSFFYMLAGIIIVASFFGLILAPALMGELPFIYSGLDEIHQQIQEENDVLEYHGVPVVSGTDNDSTDAI